jgi:eukaryotic-like serine/threonine-protein kinase
LNNRLAVVNKLLVGIDSFDINMKSSDVTVGDPSLSFIKHHKDVPDFEFTVKIGEKILNLKGLGVDSDNRIKASGSFGRVFFGADQNGNKVAVKVAQLNPSQTMSDLKREGDFLYEMDGSNNVVGASEIGYMKGNPSLMFAVMEHIEGSELQEKLVDEEKSIPLEQGISILQDVASGLQELHSEGIVHRDLKPGNVLVEDKSGKARLLDLGISRKIKDKTKVSSRTPPYASPETLSESVQGEKSDTYTFGVMMHVILSKKYPYMATPGGIATRIHRDITVTANSYPKSISLKTRRLLAKTVNSCLKCDPNQRISDTKLIERLNKIQESL